MSATTAATPEIPLSTWEAVADELLAARRVKLAGPTVARLLTATSTLPPRPQWAEAAWRAVLESDLVGLTAPGLLPMNLGSQPTATVKESVVVQIQSSRDATQPLRLCADTEESEAANLGAAQRTTATRLLKLTLTDGHVEVPAIELTTLRCFRGIPTPGEKLLIKEGAEVKCGMLLLTEEHVVCLGGSERRLRDEFAMHSNRTRWNFAAGGVEGAPKFVPLHSLTMGSGAAAPSGGRQRQQDFASVHDTTKRPLPNRRSDTTSVQHDQHSRGRGGSRGRGDGADHRGGRGGRGRGGDRPPRGGARGGHRGGRGHYDPQQAPLGGGYVAPTSKPSSAMPKFSDADFPELGGDW